MRVSATANAHADRAGRFGRQDRNDDAINVAEVGETGPFRPPPQSPVGTHPLLLAAGGDPAGAGTDERAPAPGTH